MSDWKPWKSDPPTLPIGVIDAVDGDGIVYRLHGAVQYGGATVWGVLVNALESRPVDRDILIWRPADPEIKPGTLVKLKSGGPRMTVNTVVGDACGCLWFEGDELHDAHFYASALRVVSETEPV